MLHAVCSRRPLEYSHTKGPGSKGPRHTRDSGCGRVPYFPLGKFLHLKGWGPGVFMLGHALSCSVLLNVQVVQIPNHLSAEPYRTLCMAYLYIVHPGKMGAALCGLR